MSSSERSGGLSKWSRLVVISGPSGAGKTSVCNALLERLPDAVWSVSLTTRQPRGAEVDGSSYEYVDRDEFKRREQAGELLEWAEYCGNSYGTPKARVEESLDQGKYIVLEIDVQGGAQIAAKASDSVRVFLLPPDREELYSRLKGRGTETQTQLEDRMAQVEREVSFARESGAYSHFVVNDELETTIEKVVAIVLKENKQG